MRKIVVNGITDNPGKPDKGITLWNVVRKYVRKHHPNVPLDENNSVAGAWRFRIKVLKSEIEIIDSGKSPGLKAPEDFPRKTIQAADPDFFKKLSKAINKGSVCVYRKKPRVIGVPYGNKAAWTFISAPDLVAMHNINLETELIDSLASEIAAEIDKEIINDLTTPLDVGDVMSPLKKKKKKKK